MFSQIMILKETQRRFLGTFKFAESKVSLLESSSDRISLILQFALGQLS